MLYGNTKSFSKVSDEKMILEYGRQLDEMAENQDHLLGLIANERDLLGQLALGICTESMKTIVQPDTQAVLKVISKMSPSMSADQLAHIGNAVSFHVAVTKYNKLDPKLKESWRGDHPLSDIDNLNLSHIINRYY